MAAWGRESKDDRVSPWGRSLPSTAQQGPAAVWWRVSCITFLLVMVELRKHNVRWLPIVYQDCAFLPSNRNMAGRFIAHETHDRLFLSSCLQFIQQPQRCMSC